MSTESTVEIHTCPSLTELSGNVERINALFSPFRPRESNPSNYDRKMKFWSKVIEEYTYHANKLSFTLKELQKALMLGSKTPACLGEVVDTLSNKSALLAESDLYDYAKSSVGWSSYAKVSAKRLLTKLIPIKWPSDGSEIRYVHVGYLQGVIEDLLSNPNINHKLMSSSDFKNTLKNKINVENSEELDIFINYLHIRNLCITSKIGPETVIVFGENPTISEVEKGKYDVKRLTEVLEADLDKIQQQVTLAHENAKKAVRQSRRATAKYELKRKKLAEQRADKLIKVVDSLNVIMLRIEDAETDATIISAYKAGKVALANVLKANKLTTDEVTDTMLDVQELLDMSTEISSAISQPISDADDFADLEEDLDKLLQEDKEEENITNQNTSTNSQEETIKLLENLAVSAGDVYELGDNNTQTSPSKVFQFNSIHLNKNSTPSPDHH